MFAWCLAFYRYYINYSENSLFNQICNTSKDDLNFLQQKDLSAQMRRINTILNKCGIKVSNVGKDKDKDTRKTLRNRNWNSLMI